MMHSRLLTGMILGTVLFAPATAMAYLSPEEVISEDPNSARFVPPPPSAGSTDDVVKAQQEKSAQRRAQEQAAVIGNGEVSSDGSASSEMTHDAAPSEDPAFVELLKQVNDKLNAEADAKKKTDDTQALQDARILERVKQHQDDAAAQNAFATIESQQSLHSGAPLAGSGMGTNVAVLLAILAMGGVVAWVVKLEKTELKMDN